MRMKSYSNGEKEVQRFLKTFLDTLPYPIFIKRATDGRFVYWNKAEEQLVGIGAEEAINKTDYDIVPKEQADFFRKIDKEVFKKESILVIPEEPHYVPHLGNRILRTIKAPIYDENKEPLFLLGISVDITEAKQNEDELKKYREHLEELVADRTKELEETNRNLQTEITERKAAQQALDDARNFLDKIINSISDPVFVKNEKHQWVMVNEAFSDYSDLKREDFIGKTDFDVYAEEEAKVFWEMDEKVFDKGEENVNIETVTDAKGMAHIIATKKTLYQDDKNNKFIVGVFRDITELKLAEEELKKHRDHLEDLVNERTAELKTANTKLKEHEEVLQEVNALLEEQQEELMQQKEELQVTLDSLQKTQDQLVESEKMAAVGGLVAGVAHEMNTPVGVGITAISNQLDSIDRMSTLYEKDEIRRDEFKTFLDSSREVSKLIQKNLERAAALIQSFKQVSTDQVTEQQRVFAFKEYLDDILLSLRPKFIDKKIDFTVECDDELQLNSYPGVYAQIFTNLLLNSLQHGFYKRDKGTITIKAEMDQELLKIHYADDGGGISKKDLPHIFEPFYTSGQHRGTGLGLNIIYNLVKQKLHGTIACESEERKGVLFKIEVPIK